MSNTLKGTLTYWSDENGHLLWLFLEDEFKGLEHAHLLQDGDYVVIFDENDAAVFNGYIDAVMPLADACIGSCDCCEKYALGFRVNWIQRGWSAHDWARLFVRYHRNGEFPYRAELVKRYTH